MTWVELRSRKTTHRKALFYCYENTAVIICPRAGFATPIALRSSGVNRHGGRIVQIVQESPNRLAGGRVAEFRRDLGQRREGESAQMHSRMGQRQRDAVTNTFDHRAAEQQQIDVYNARAFRGKARAAHTRLYEIGRASCRES